MQEKLLPTLLDTLSKLINNIEVEHPFDDSKFEVFDPHNFGRPVELYCIYKNNICKAKLQLIASPKSFNGIKEYSICVSSPRFGLNVFKVNRVLDAHDSWNMTKLSYEFELFFDSATMSRRLKQLFANKNEQYSKIITDIEPKIKTPGEISSYVDNLMVCIMDNPSAVVRIF